MSIPGHSLSSVPVPSSYLFPDNIEPSKTVDYELGGIGLDDPSAGLQYQVWTGTLEIDQDTDIGSVYLEAPNWPKQLQFARLGVSEISIAFDQNMNPFIAFMEAGAARFWWFDTVADEQVFSTLPAGSRSPKCCMDDKRPEMLSVNDIILAYIRDDNLYYREQRDRYEIEYLLKTGGMTQDLIRVGMNRGNRLQFAIGLYP